MYQYKLKADILFQIPKTNKKRKQQSTIRFALPPTALVKVNPNPQTKPLTNVAQVTGAKVRTGEVVYAIKDGDEFTVKTNTPVETWTGHEYRFKKASCSCKGHYLFKFNLLEII